MRNPPTLTPARRVLALVVGALLLGALSVGFDAATAHAARIGPQEVLRPPATFPIDFGGRRYRLHGPIPKGFVVLHRRVRMTPSEHRHRLRFVCPRGVVALAPALNDPSELGIAVTDSGRC